MLSKATGAKYGLKKFKGKILVVLLSVVMIALSYYFLVVIARGGTAYFNQPFWKAFFDLGYSIGDAIIFTIALAIFGLSWKYLGGRFKQPIIAILIAFGIMYFADFTFSWRDGRNLYYNGDLSDLLFLLAIAVMGAALCLLDPSKLRSTAKVSAPPTENPAQADEAPAQEPQLPAEQQPDIEPVTEHTDQSPPEEATEQPPASKPAPESNQDQPAQEVSINQEQGENS